MNSLVNATAGGTGPDGMTGLRLIFAAAVMMGGSGVPALFGSRGSTNAQRLTAAMMVVGSLIGVVGVTQTLLAPTVPMLEVPWSLPLGRFSVAVDALSAAFLLPVLTVPTLASVYALGYWPQQSHPHNGRMLGLFCGVMAGAMVMLVIARDAVLFLMAWEVMAVAAFFAATAEDDDDAVRRAGWIYLVATHLGTLCLIAMFALWHRGTGSLALIPVGAGVAWVSGCNAVFVLTLMGFGLKAGIMPLHVWLPGAHANAPSHVSAIMSGVILKMGIYGIVRMSSLLPPPPAWCGGLLLGLGAVSGILAIAFAIAQGDLKMILAYSSIENIGIIALALGLALTGRALGRADWMLLGIAGALLHVWNHSLFKSLLFLNAGAVIHHAHTRRIDQLGGLAAQMPRTAGLFLIGAIAICALPPLNGFTSEWLIYIGLCRAIIGTGGAGWAAAGLGVAALALIGALALACFVRLYGAIFLGNARTTAPDASGHGDPGLAMTLPMVGLAGACLTIGVLPWLATPLLQRAAQAWCPSVALYAIEPLAPLHRVSIVALSVGIILIAGMLAIRALLRRRQITHAGTWDCGYAFPTPRMQYTASSFGQMLTALFTWAVRPSARGAAVVDAFPAPVSFATVIVDMVLEKLVMPIFRGCARYLPLVRLFQQGRIQVYILYFGVVVALLLIWGHYGV